MGEVLGIIGGSGLYALPLRSARWRAVETPWGVPSDELLEGELEGLPVAFLPRHGRGHRLLPSEVPQRANVAALKAAGCTAVLSVAAAGSFRDELAPGTLVLATQIVDDTRGRPSTFFGDGIVAHVSLARPVVHELLDRIEAAAREANVRLVRGGTYLCIEGPRFATRAESLARRAAGHDVVGMTAMPEAALVREAEMAYALVAMVTDFDGWTDAPVTTAGVLEAMANGVAQVQALVRAVAGRLARDPLPRPSAEGWERALDGAVVTARAAWPEATRARLATLCPRIFG
ncbi:MAG: S-methyl-5'-thioadenosine phosphorylase [Sphingomonadaceae bacterium]|uniref:phosphorylase family protein n=1 Tax=Thermaurantiacus sp. TaxID=2820283 RepID=UPI00298ED8DF|nr:S-methyl-5'-thioadenosine phosphorylase [Thermaurantiacus sp.]MCS6986803.1 S-methyl-5'-thioadenosine phosphorylase [Sphingomonadaceae bacterium]MDW8413934.1 S-methyl-5'-thioadenosine phosphorylase [Thermaurantiacus sp.]